MSSGGQLPQLPQQSDATGATGGAPTTSQQMQAYSPAGGKGGYPAPQQRQDINPFASQYQQPQQMRQMDNGGMGNAYARRRMDGGLQGQGIGSLMGGLQRLPSEPLMQTYPEVMPRTGDFTPSFLEAQRQLSQPQPAPPQILTQYQPYKIYE
jgi:hypothetical protein